MKTSRLAIRMDDKKHHALKIAAAYRNMTISQYVLEAIAEKMLKDESAKNTRPDWIKGW